jgi:hypothetical protein
MRTLARRALFLATAVLALSLSSDLALACPKCYGAADTSVLRAYLWTAGLLSFLPLGIIGGIVYTLKRLDKKEGHPSAGGRDPERR